MAGNPFADGEYKSYVVAHLPEISYLDFRLVSTQMVGLYSNPQILAKFPQIFNSLMTNNKHSIYITHFPLLREKKLLPSTRTLSMLLSIMKRTNRRNKRKSELELLRIICSEYVSRPVNSITARKLHNLSVSQDFLES